MRRRFQFRRLLIIIGVVVLGTLLIYGLTQINYQCDWTGFGVCNFVEGSDEDYRPEKTLWDWLELLIVPTVLALGAIYFNRVERRNELEIAQQERQNEAQIAEERAQDARLQTYLDQMTELLLGEELRKSRAGDEVRHVAQVRTLIALRRLDRERRTILMQFLRASELVGIDEAQMIVDFRGVDLSSADLSFTSLASISLRDAQLRLTNLQGAKLQGADLTRTTLQGTNLQGANLQGTNLQGAKLQGAKLQGANLFGADLHTTILWRADLRNAYLQGANLFGADLQGAKLQGAKLQGADLTRTNLTDAIVTAEQLTQASSLEGVTMPDGAIHP